MRERWAHWTKEDSDREVVPVVLVATFCDRDIPIPLEVATGPEGVYLSRLGLNDKTAR